MWLVLSLITLCLSLCCFPALLISSATAENHVLLFFPHVQLAPKCCGKASSGREAGCPRSQAPLTVGMRGQLWAGQHKDSSSPELMSPSMKSIESHRVTLSFED